MGKKRKYRNNPRQHVQRPYPSGEVLSKLQALFNKVYSYNPPSQDQPWQLPKPMAMFTSGLWQDATLMNMKTDLNRVKNMLSDVDVTPWHEHTQFTHTAGKVMQMLRTKVSVELGTQAWCKFHEILGRFQLIPESGDHLETVHLCEAPGAFVTSLNHFIKSHCTHKTWHWRATTLNPLYEGNDPCVMIDDAILIRHTLNNWYFGEDDTGDIMLKSNILGLSQIYKGQQVDLVTADGSVNCQNNPAEQEKVVAYLHFCEAVSCFTILAPGGHFVIKMFTLYEAESVCLLYLLNCLFEKVEIIKPATSKPGNSEVYVVCQRFIGIDQSTLYRLLSQCEQALFHETVMFSPDQIPKSFLDQHIAACEFFKSFQVETIESNFACFLKMSASDRHNTEFLKDQCAKMYIDLYEVYPIDMEDRVVPPTTVGNKKVCLGGSAMNHQRKRLQGSYNERQKLKSLPWCDRVQRMKRYEIEESGPSWMELQHASNYLLDRLPKWKSITGCPIEKVLCSRFCHQALLDEYAALLENAAFLKSDKHTKDEEDPLKGDSKLLTKILMKENGRFSCEVIGTETPLLMRLKESLVSSDKMDVESCLFLSDVHHPEVSTGQGELESKQSLLSLTIKALKNLKPGDSYVCHIYTSLTRYVVGIIYALTHCFIQVTLNDLTDEGLSFGCFIICKSFVSSPPDVLALLEDVQNSEDGADVLQFIPTECLLDTSFHSVISNLNDYILMKRINAMLEKELDFISNG